MSLVAAAGPLAYETSITTMSESGLIVLSICAVLLMGFLLLPPILAGRAPRRKGPASALPQTGPVQGGVHAGDGRSVAPHRTAPAEVFDQEAADRGKTAQATVIHDGDEEAGAAGDEAGPASRE
jgi:hypothetical protein